MEQRRIRAGRRRRARHRASFGSRTKEPGPREIADYGELIDWVAAQPWSNGRVGLFSASYDGQAAELIAGLGNPHVTAVAALFSPVRPPDETFTVQLGDRSTLDLPILA